MSLSIRQEQLAARAGVFTTDACAPVCVQQTCVCVCGCAWWVPECASTRRSPSLNVLVRTIRICSFLFCGGCARAFDQVLPAFSSEEGGDVVNTFSATC
jgi:hypothetical protein